MGSIFKRTNPTSGGTQLLSDCLINDLVFCGGGDVFLITKILSFDQSVPR